MGLSLLLWLSLFNVSGASDTRVHVHQSQDCAVRAAGCAIATFVVVQEHNIHSACVLAVLFRLNDSGSADGPRVNSWRSLLTTTSWLSSRSRNCNGRGFRLQRPECGSALQKK